MGVYIKGSLKVNDGMHILLFHTTLLPIRNILRHRYHIAQITNFGKRTRCDLVSQPESDPETTESVKYSICFRIYILLPPQGFGPEAKTRGGIIEPPA